MVEDGKYGFYTCAKQVYRTNTYCFDGECVLLGGNSATGNFSLFYTNEKLDAYQRTYIITSENRQLSVPYIYFVIKDYLSHFKSASIGTTTKFLIKAMLDKVFILLPSPQILEKFKRYTQSNFDSMVNLKLQNQNLKKQRDLLLPRLMSGKLEV